MEDIYIPIIKITERNGTSHLTTTLEEAETAAKEACQSEMVLDCFLGGIEVQIPNGRKYILTNPNF